MIKFEQSSHWYSREGNPKHDAGLREARVEFLYPSVTSIDKDVFKNDFLDRWKMDELAKAAAGTFKQLHESEEDYANRIYEISLGKSKEATEFGKEIHDAIEGYPMYPLNAELAPWIDRFGRWYDVNVEEVLHRERVVLDHDIGVAGRCDFIGLRKGEVIMCDWKTSGVKKDDKGKKKPVFYPSWPRQLAFYAVAYAKETKTFPSLPRCISVVMDSNEPDDPFVKEWTNAQIVSAYQDFVVGAWLWFGGRGIRKPFWPAPSGAWSLTPSIPMPI